MVEEEAAEARLIIDLKKEDNYEEEGPITEDNTAFHLVVH
jgi:hypothetical protein